MIFIYAIEGDPTTGPPARELLTQLRKRAGGAVTSELSLAEVLAPTKGRGKIPAPLKEAYVDLMVEGHWLKLEPVSRQVLYGTVELGSAPGTMKLPDAIHLATAVHARCQYLVTNDLRMPVPAGMTKVEPTTDGVAHIREVLA